MKRIFINVKTRARESGVERIDETHFNVRVKNRPINGAANKELLEVLADYFKLAKTCIEIHAGKGTTYKVINIID